MRAKSGGGGGGSRCSAACFFCICKSVRDYVSVGGGRVTGVKSTPLTLALLAAGPLHVGRRRACWTLWGRAGDGLALYRAVLLRTEGEARC